MARVSSAPQNGDGPYSCVNCPAALPDRYVLFPPSPLNIADGRPYNQLLRIVSGSNAVKLTTSEVIGEASAANFEYELSPDLQVKSVTPSDAYWTWKLKFDDKWNGRAGQPTKHAVRVWSNEKGWLTETIQFTGLTKGDVP